MAAKSKDGNGKFPENLVIQSDNPTNQAKKTATCVFLSYLVSVLKFATATWNFLTVGHTHEDIDQVFGFMCALLDDKLDDNFPKELLPRKKVLKLLKKGRKTKSRRGTKQLSKKR